MGAQEWLSEIGKAADDLGWGVLHIGPSRIVVGRGDVTVTIESILLGGGLLHDVLRPSLPSSLAENIDRLADVDVPEVA